MSIYSGCKAQTNNNLRCNNHCNSYFKMDIGSKGSTVYSNSKYYCDYRDTSLNYQQMRDFC